MGLSSQVSYVKGLYGALAKWPLGFSPKTASYSDYTVIMGAGKSADPEASTVDGANFMDFYLKTTGSGASDVAGLKIQLDAQSAGSGYAIKATGKTSAGVSHAEIGGIYAQAQASGGTITGQQYAGFFEYLIDSGVTNAPAGGCIQLSSIMSGTRSSVNGFISVRDYGADAAHLMLNLFNFGSEITSGSGKMYYGCTLRCQWAAGTVKYLFLSSAENALTFTGDLNLTGNLVITAGDIDLSASTTGVYDLILKAAQADALSIRYGATDLLVFDTSTAAVKIGANAQFQVRDSGMFLYSPSDGVLTLQSDGTLSLDGTTVVQIGGAAVNLTGSMTFTGATHQIGNLTIATNKELRFRDADMLIYSPSDGVLGMQSDVTLSLGAPTTNIWGTNVNVSGIFGVTGATTITGATQIIGNLTMNTNKYLYWRDTGLSIYSPSDGVLSMGSDHTLALEGIDALNLDSAAIRLTGAINLNGAATASSTLALQDTITVATNKQMRFRDTGLFIYSPSDGVLTMQSDGTLALVGTSVVQIGGPVTTDNMVTINGTVTYGINMSSGIKTNAIYVASGACTAGLVFGAKSSDAAIGHHIGVANSADTAGDKAIAVFADDGNATLATDAQGINSRCLIMHAQAGACGMDALRGHLRIVASITPSEQKAFTATSGVVEVTGTYTFGNATNIVFIDALSGSVVLAGTPTVSANVRLCGALLNGGFTAAYNGDTNPAVGVMYQCSGGTYGFQFALGFHDGVSGMLSTGTDSASVTHKVAVWINGVGTRYIHIFSD